MDMGLGIFTTDSNRYGVEPGNRAKAELRAINGAKDVAEDGDSQSKYPALCQVLFPQSHVHPHSMLVLKKRNAEIRKFCG